MRVCFLGNSHLIPIMDAWNSGGQADFEADFLAARANTLAALAVAHGRLCGTDDPTRAALARIGVEDLPVKGYDAFTVVGLGFTINTCTSMFAKYRTWRAAEPDPPQGMFLASRSCLLAATEERLRRSTAMSLARRLRTATSAPILLAEQPGPSERVLDIESDERELARDLDAGGRGLEIRQIYEEARAGFAGEVEIVQQPTATIARGIMTRRRYDRWESDASAEPPRPVDVFHANAEYGHLAIRDLQQRLATPSRR